jgi:hypothetical protein
LISKRRKPLKNDYPTSATPSKMPSMMNNSQINQETSARNTGDLLPNKILAI